VLNLGFDPKTNYSRGLVQRPHRKAVVRGRAGGERTVTECSSRCWCERLRRLEEPHRDHRTPITRAHRDLSGDDLQPDALERTNFTDANLNGTNLQSGTTKGAITKRALTNDATVCVNAITGPRTKPGLRGTGRVDTSD
jgi:hypothetical protein